MRIYRSNQKTVLELEENEFNLVAHLIIQCHHQVKDKMEKPLASELSEKIQRFLWTVPEIPKQTDTDMEFDRLKAQSARIINAKRNLFIGEPYKSPMKDHKRNTWRRLCKMQDQNIKEVAALFG